MRYQSWDVLLFPADSRIPIQEFDTKCHVTCRSEQRNVSIDGSINEDRTRAA